MTIGDPIDHESSGPEDTHWESRPRPASSNWRNRYRIGGIATPSGRCTWLASCSRMGFDETDGLCPEHYEQDIIEPAEETLRHQREHWLAACAAAGCLKRVFKCSCGLVTDLFTLEDYHLPSNPTHSRMFPVRGEPSTAMPRQPAAPKQSVNDVEEFG